MTTVRQTVTTVQQSGSHGAAPGLDNSLDALLEDLQSSVSARGSGPAVNGLGGGGVGGGGGSSSYRREVTRTVEREAAPHVMHLSPANPTTVVAERSASPLLPAGAPGDQRSVTYKTYSYQTYQTASSGDNRSATLPASTVSAAISTEQDRLQQNLNELDSLLVDLRHAQRTGFDPPHASASTLPGGSTTTTRTEVVTRGGVDPGLLEPVGHSTPAASMGRSAPSTPGQQHVSRVEYKTYRTEQRQHYQDGSPARYVAPDSPRLQPKRSSSAQRELTYGSEHVSRSRRRSPSPSQPLRREYVEARERYREKSPSNQRLQREVFYNESHSTHHSSHGSSSLGRSPSGGRYRTPSPPPPQRRGASPGPPQPPAADYPAGGGGSTTRVTTQVRTYNYGSSSGGPGGPVGPGRPSSPPGDRDRSRGRSPSPSPSRPPYRSPSPVAMSRPPFQPGDEPATRVSHTTHTWQYDSRDEGALRYPVNATPRGQRREPEAEPLLPRPFPTPSPPPPGTQPPKRLDDLMATFGDTGEHRDGHPGGYYRSEKTTTTTTSSSRSGGPGSGPGTGPGMGPGGEPAHPTSNGTAVALASSKEVKEKELQRVPTTNQAGPPVYYPPGVEMFAQKEEAAMQMSGKAKAKGKYKYEYESREKSKEIHTERQAKMSVCLPVCCALPCVIM